jgi:bla regulator protein BlaR1
MIQQRIPSPLLGHSFCWALVLVVTAGHALGQTTKSASPSTASDSNAKMWKFEVVSIRQTKSDDAQPYGLAEAGPMPDGWRMRNGTLALAILTAYTPQNGAAIYTGKEVQGQPEWTLSDRYDIDARVSDADRTDWQKPKLQKVMLESMLQAMLADRCKVAAHREVKELPVYSLVVIKNGPKFKETVPDDPHPGTPVPGGGTVLTEDGGGTMHFYATAMGSLTPLLTNWVGKPVLDGTGLTARYDFRLQRPALGGPSAGSADGDPRPSIPSALEDLGLKLESAKGPVETFVIDHVERPSEN